MKKNIIKRIFIYILTTVLIIDSLRPGNAVMQVRADGIKRENSGDGEAKELDEEAESQSGTDLQTEPEMQAESELQAESGTEEKIKTEGTLNEGQDSENVSGLIHIASLNDLDALPGSDFDKHDFDKFEYDKAIYIEPNKKIRLFVKLPNEIAFCENNGVENNETLLTWSIIRAKRGTMPGSVNIIDTEDDWLGFEIVPDASFFSIQEDYIGKKAPAGNKCEFYETDSIYKDDDGIFNKTLIITGSDNYIDGSDDSYYNDYDYYIRAELRYSKGQNEQKEHIAITTVPVLASDSISAGDSSADENNVDLEGAAIDIESEDGDTEKGCIEVTDAEEGEGDAKEADIEVTDAEEGEGDAKEADIEATNAEDRDGDVKEESIEVSGGEAGNVDEEVEDSGEEVGNIDEEVDSLSDMDKNSIDDISVSKLTFGKTNMTMNPGNMTRLSVVVIPEGLNPDIIWNSSNSDIAVIDDMGNITALSEGSSEITAKCGEKTAMIRIDVVRTDAEKNNDRPTDDDGNIIEISDEIWVAGFERESEALTYSGNKITQELRIYHKATLLKEKTDYVLTYKNNINASAYNSPKAPSVSIKMKGQYSGGRTLYFTIAPRNIDENNSMGYEQVMQYAEKMKKPVPTLYYNGKKLVLNKDFDCDYSDLPQDYRNGNSYEDGKTYGYTVNGMGNFTGSFTMKMSVIKEKTFNFESAVVTLDKKQYEYHGIPLTESDIDIIYVKIGKKTLVSGLYEYKVYAAGSGRGYVEVYPSDEGRSKGYRGVKKINIRLVGDRNIKDTGNGTNWQDTITFSMTDIVNNGGICQKNTELLIYNKNGISESLNEGIDYTVKYNNNKKAGTATVTFVGIGRYTGSYKKKYKIVPNTKLYVRWHDTDELGVPEVSYSKGGAVPEFELSESDGRVLNPKTDYFIKVKDNKAPGIMTCEIIGKGNYKGYKSTTRVKVISADISRGTISVPDKCYSSKPDAWKSAITIKDVNGRKLKAGIDYDKKLIYTYDKMEAGSVPDSGTIVYVTALGINNYKETAITGSYRIYDTGISKLTVVIDAQEYTGREIELTAGDIHVYESKADVKAGKEITASCYEIITYRNNVKAGTAKVTLRGIGNYGGLRTCSFKINKKEYLTTRVKQISLNETSLSLGTGNSRQLTAELQPETASNKTVVWSSSNTKIVVVNEDGIITAKQPGRATITATAQDTGKKAVCKVKAAVIPVNSFDLNIQEIRQYEGTEYQLSVVEMQPVNASYSTIKWKSTNPEAASVDETGLVSLNTAGMAVIKAYTDNERFIRKCLVIVEGNNDDEAETEPEGIYLTPQMFRTCEEDDDTKAFNDAIQNIDANCNTLYVPAGTYIIDAQTSINLTSNMNIVMSTNAVLKAVANSNRFYDIIHVNSVNNVTISGGQLIGERYEHGNTSGEWGMGIGVYDSDNISINNVQISECWGDGIYLGSHHEEDLVAGCQNITITNCNLFNNRRNNLSIVCSDYVNIDNCTFNYANGTAPEFGIDIESNNAENPCEHISISNSTFDGNVQGSMGIITSADDIKISDCVLNGSFVNYDGSNVIISNSEINGEMNARIGVLLVDGSRINDGSDEEDLLAASFSAAQDSYTVGEYGIDDSNAMSYSIIEDDESSSGKALCLRRRSQGSGEAGYYLKLSDFEWTDGEASVLEAGETYRFEYIVKGSGQWGIKTSQTGWYPCKPYSDKYSMGIVTYKAEPIAMTETVNGNNDCYLMLYAVDVDEDMYLEIDSIRIYKVR